MFPYMQILKVSTLICISCWSSTTFALLLLAPSSALLLCLSPWSWKYYINGKYKLFVSVFCFFFCCFMLQVLAYPLVAGSYGVSLVA